MQMSNKKPLAARAGVKPSTGNATLLLGSGNVDVGRFQRIGGSAVAIKKGVRIQDSGARKYTVLPF